MEKSENDFMDKYENLVWDVAYRAAKHLKCHVSEVLGMAYLAVQTCWEKFDESLGNQFTTYAYRNAFRRTITAWDNEKDLPYNWQSQFLINAAIKSLEKKGLPTTDDNLMEETGYKDYYTLVRNKFHMEGGTGENVPSDYKAVPVIDWKMAEEVIEIPENFRVLKMRFYDGLSASEISKALNVSKSRVHFRLRTAINQLRESAKFTNNHQHLLGV